MPCDNEQLKKDIMRRVEHVHFMKTFVRPFVVECSVLVILVGVESYSVSIVNVISNASTTRSFTESVKYILGAFENTELSIKAVSLAIIVVAILVARDSLIGVRKSRRTESVAIQSA